LYRGALGVCAAGCLEFIASRRSFTTATFVQDDKKGCLAVILSVSYFRPERLFMSPDPLLRSSRTSVPVILSEASPRAQSKDLREAMVFCIYERPSYPEELCTNWRGEVLQLSGRVRFQCAITAQRLLES
jgi:hypothetical protein